MRTRLAGEGRRAIRRACVLGVVAGGGMAATYLVAQHLAPGSELWAGAVASVVAFVWLCRMFPRRQAPAK